MIRRLPIVLVPAIAIVTMFGGPATAWTLTPHEDPDDVTFIRDIRRVSTDKTRHRIYVRVRAWQRVEDWAAVYYVNLDTKGSAAIDRTIWMDARFGCEVWNRDVRTIGERDIRRLTPKTVGCAVPKAWFRMGKPVYSFP